MHTINESSHTGGQVVRRGLAPPYADCNHLTWAPGRRLDRHGHDFLQCIQVLAGTLQVDWGAGWVSLRRGMVHVLPPGWKHRLRSPGGQRQFGLNTRVAVDERGLLALALDLVREPCVVTVPVPVWIEGLADARLAERLHAAELTARLDTWLIALLTTLQPQADAGQLLRRAVERCVDGPCTVLHVARSLGMSRATLQRVCQAHFGCGVSHLHERMRLERAAGRLAAGQMSIQTCAETSGYGDVYTFSRAFRRVIGMPPGRWRDHHRQRLG